MATLLRIDASPRGNASVSRRLGDAFTESWKSAHADGSVVLRDLAVHQPTYVDLPWIAGAFTPPDQQTPEHKAALKQSDELIAELKAADHILITTPFYNFNVPAVLKAWIDHVVRAGVTFKYENGAPKGLVADKKATVIVASGGQYAAGTPYHAYDHLTPSLQGVLGFIGITDVTFLHGGGVSSYAHEGKTEEQFLQPLQQQATELATG